jgi:L-alanine-DL-glutamate epimerase-like enolase superfamily enzyme
VSLDFASRFAVLDVSWFEEPVSSDDPKGLHQLRDRADAGWKSEPVNTDSIFLTSAACEAAAVDVLQADATRYAGKAIAEIKFGK